VSKS
jgi:hypothetical protein